MTVAEILASESLRHTEFPVTRDRVFLAHAGVCPLPARVAEAMHSYTAACTGHDQEAVLPPGLFAKTRELAANLLKARPEEIALVGPTSLALSFVAAGWRFKKHDNILVYQDDFPSNVYPWMALSDKGVQVRFLNTRALGQIRPVDVMGQVDENTRLVSLASCHFLSGYRIDLRAIGDFLRKRNILFCVDGIQTLGAFPTLVEHVDFLAADAHKWLLGPCSAGILYVRHEIQDRLRPIVQGWHNVKSPDLVTMDDLVYRTDARRYEAGTANLAGLVGLKAALELIQEIGIDPISLELQRKRSWLVPELVKKGYSVLNDSGAEENSAGITSFYGSGSDLPALHLKLEKERITTSLRSDRSGRKYIRLSPHFYNTDEELQRMLSLIG